MDTIVTMALLFEASSNYVKAQTDTTNPSVLQGKQDSGNVVGFQALATSLGGFGPHQHETPAQNTGQQGKGYCSSFSQRPSHAQAAF